MILNVNFDFSVRVFWVSFNLLGVFVFAYVYVGLSLFFVFGSFCSSFEWQLLPALCLAVWLAGRSF